eukprot:scaffold67887_cov66-Phaeocystis_antarctica.AAC.4
MRRPAATLAPSLGSIPSSNFWTCMARPLLPKPSSVSVCTASLDSSNAARGAKPAAVARAKAAPKIRPASSLTTDDQQIMNSTSACSCRTAASLNVQHPDKMTSLSLPYRACLRTVATIVATDTHSSCPTTVNAIAGSPTSCASPCPAKHHTSRPLSAASSWEKEIPLSSSAFSGPPKAACTSFASLTKFGRWTSVSVPLSLAIRPTGCGSAVMSTVLSPTSAMCMRYSEAAAQAAARSWRSSSSASCSHAPLSAIPSWHACRCRAASTESLRTSLAAYRRFIAGSAPSLQRGATASSGASTCSAMRGFLAGGSSAATACSSRGCSPAPSGSTTCSATASAASTASAAASAAAVASAAAAAAAAAAASSSSYGFLSGWT